MPRLADLAKTVRSKNAGVDNITFDIIFSSAEVYRHVLDSGCITPAAIASLYGVQESDVQEFVEFDPAHAIKFTLKRKNSSGSPGDSDVFGAQQYAPLLDIPIPAISEL